MPRIVVAGATGYIGSSIMASELGTEVVGAIGRASSLPQTPRRSAYWVIDRDCLQLNSEPGVKQSVQGAVLIHAIGAGRGRRSTDIYGANVGTTEALVKWAEREGIESIVYFSGYGVGPDAGSTYYQAKHEAELVLRASKLPSVILRCSYIVGGGRDEFTPTLVTAARKGIVKIPGDGAYRIQPVHIDDLLLLVAEIIRRPAQNATIDVLGHAISYKGYVSALLSAARVAHEIEEVGLEKWIREAVFETEASFSLDELAILCADRIGEPLRRYGNVSILRDVQELIKRVADELDRSGNDTGE